jgi:chromosome segregation protein
MEGRAPIGYGDSGARGGDVRFKPDGADIRGSPGRAVIDGMRGALRAVFEKAHGHLREAVTSLKEGPAAQAYQDNDARLRKALDDAREQFKRARERAQAHEVALKQIEALSKRIFDTETRISALAKAAEGKETVQQAFAEAATGWSAVLADRAAMVRRQCEKIGEYSHGLIRGQVAASADTGPGIALLVDTARGTSIRGAKFESLGERVASQTEPLSAWLGVIEELGALIGIGGESLPPPCPTLRAVGFGDKELRALGSRLDDDTWIRLRLTAPKDVVRFEYRAREGDYIAFSDASAGQRATALMRVLLSQEDVPLIVDQPEDDLDNSVIHEVARDIWTAKVRRQLLFASHNANLVVNGDADLIAFFDYAVAGEATSGEVKAQGAIDDTSIRNAITSVMEGGREAFGLRRAKYNF